MIQFRNQTQMAGWPNGKASLSGFSCMAKIAGSSPVLVAKCRLSDVFFSAFLEAF